MNASISKLLAKKVQLAVSIVVAILVAVMILEYNLSSRVPHKSFERVIAERQRLKSEHSAQPVTFLTSDGEQIAGLLIVRPHAVRAFIVCHGYKGSKERMGYFADMFPHDTLLFIDLRGHGESTGKRSSLGLNEYKDAIAAYSYLRDHISSTVPIFGIGISLGGSALLRAAAAGVKFDGIVADSSPTEFKNMIRKHLWKKHYVPYFLGWLALTWYEALMGCRMLAGDCSRYARNITSPVLILHDKDDHVVSYDHACTLYRCLGSACKQLITVTGTHHGRMFEYDAQQYRAYIEQFITACYANKMYQVIKKELDHAVEQMQKITA